MLLLIDNYDSFVYNLARYFVELGCETLVVRNDAIDIPGIQRMAPQAIVISPGPCTPNEAGISMEIVSQLCHQVPILGVCLGHQAIAAALGGRVIRAPYPVHGRTSLIHHSGEGLFENVPSPLRVARYHSLVADESTLPEELKITARTDDGLLMAFQHAKHLLFGVQFHPESVLTQDGRQLLANFAQIAGFQPIRTQATDWNEPDPPSSDPAIPVLAWW